MLPSTSRRSTSSTLSSVLRPTSVWSSAASRQDDHSPVQVTLSLLRVLISIARPRTFELGDVPNSMIYRSADQYPNVERIPAILILRIDSPIYFANSNYLRERIS